MNMHTLIKYAFVLKIVFSGYLDQIVCDSKVTTFQNNCEYVLNEVLNCSVGTEEVDIGLLFQELEGQFQPDQRRFNKLIWDIPIINQTLPENVFRSFEFDIIEWMQPLAKVHSNAFASTSYGFSWNDLVGYTKGLLRNNPGTEYDIYKAFSQIKDPVTLWFNLESDSSHEIPSEAFKDSNWTDINWIRFEGNFIIGLIGDNILQNVPSSLLFLSFKVQKIYSIFKYAFQIEPCSDCPKLTISLESVQLTGDLVIGVFDIKGRQINLELRHNSIKYLRQELFEPFLMNNESNTLDVTGNPFECSPLLKLSWEWLIKNPEYKNRITGANCVDGTSIWDMDWESMDEIPVNDICGEWGQSEQWFGCGDDTYPGAVLDIEHIFTELEKQVPPGSQLVENFRWDSGLKDGILPANTFRSLTVANFYLNAPNLMKVHVDSIGPSLEFLFPQSENKIRSYPGTDYDFFEALGRMSNLKSASMRLDADFDHVIPDDAFKNNRWTTLYGLVIEKIKISRIGDNFLYYFPKTFTSIHLSNNKIESISPRAFKLNPDSSDFYLSLSSSEITADILEPGVFDMGQTKVTLMLDNNKLTILRENVFGQFMMNNQANSISISGNPLECTPESKLIFKWLLNKESEYKDRISGATCADGTDFWDVDWDAMEYPLDTFCDYSESQMVTCRSTEEIDIDELITNLQTKIDLGVSYFVWLYISLKDGILPENTFKNIKVEVLYLYSPNLEKIHVNSFDQANMLWYIDIGSPNKLKVRPGDPDYDLFVALGRVINIQEIYLNLDPDYANEIPDNAFENNQWTAIEKIAIMEGGHISRVGSNVLYHIPDTIHHFIIQNIIVDKFEKDSFKLKPCSDCTGLQKFTLAFYDINLIDDKLEPGMFDMGQREVDVQLGGEITLLSEEMFHQFLINNLANILDVGNNPLNCSQESKPIFDWLISRPEYKPRVIDANCANGTSIWDIDWQLWEFRLDQYCEYKQTTFLNCTLSTEEVDIEAVFVNLEIELPGQNDQFVDLLWSNRITKGILPPNVFRKFMIERVTFTSPNLEKIHIDAIGSSVKYFFPSSPTKLKNFPNTEYDFYQALGRMTNLKGTIIEFDPDQPHEIPDNAFANNQWNEFSILNFRGQFNFTRIGDNVIYHVSEEFFHFDIVDAKIDSISPSAFKLRPCTICTDINLAYPMIFQLINNQLTDDILEPGVFDMGSRPVGLNLAQNLLTHMKEEVFHQFLLNNESNTIEMMGNPLNCSQDSKTQFQWLLNNPEYKNRVTNANCENGNTPIWDYEWGQDISSTSTTTTTTTTITSTATTHTTENPNNGTTDSPGSDNTTTDSSTNGTSPTTSTVPSYKTTPSTTTSTPSTTTNHPNTMCNLNGEYNGWHNVSYWPQVYPGQYSSVNCTNGKGMIRWLCGKFGKFDEKRGPIFEECWLDELVDRDVDSVDDVIEILDILIESLTNDSSLNFISSLKKVETIIENLDIFLQNNTIDSMVAQNITQRFVQVFSESIEQSIAWNNGTDSEKLRTSSQMLLLIQKTSFTANCYLNSENKTQEFVSNKLYEKLFFNFTEDIHFGYNSSSMVIPNIREFESIEEDYYSCREDSALGLVINNLNDFMTKTLKSTQKMNSEIIAFSLRNSNKTHNLKKGQNVIISIKHRNRIHLGDRVECMYWDYSSLEWSSEGCQTIIKESDRDTTVCQCNHLTNFAAIMDLSGREDNDSTKHVLTLVFCSLSVISLVITIVLIFKKDLFFKILKKYKTKDKRKLKANKTNANTENLLKRRDQIVINQSICLLIADIIIMFGMERRDNTHDGVCYAVSFLLLYFLLSTFVWMLLHGIHLFRMTHNVFEIAIKNIVINIIGYVVPLFICVIGLISVWINIGVFDEALVGSDYFCWISSPKHPENIWILIGPALVIILANVAIIGYLFRSVGKLKMKSKIRQVLGFLFLVLNLGLTWTLFLSYMQRISASPKIFSYLFIVVNSSQGVFVLAYQLAMMANNYYN